VKIVQIVPVGDPALGGVGAYAAALGRELADRCGIESELVATGDSLPGNSLGGDSLGAATCLLHYANYAYQPRGCPLGLARDLRRWRLGGSPGRERRLVTFFHEVYATGPFWQSSFWLAPVQRRIAADLARASDRVATSLDLYGRMLEGLYPRGAQRLRGPREPIAVLPVFSTVGEPASVPALADREPRMLIFGGAGARSRAYGEEREALGAACRALGLGEIVDLGPPLASGLPGDVDGIPVRALGSLPAAQVSARMLAARAGFLAYPSGFLPKSSIFAAYCAHGLVPVRAGARDRAESAPHWTPGSPAVAAQALADAARAWYRGHSIARQAESFRELLVPSGART
jgi:hypothetical protein